MGPKSPHCLQDKVQTSSERTRPFITQPLSTLQHHSLNDPGSSFTCFLHILFPLPECPHATSEVLKYHSSLNFRRRCHLFLAPSGRMSCALLSPVVLHLPAIILSCLNGLLMFTFLIRLGARDQALLLFLSVSFTQLPIPYNTCSTHIFH